MKLSNHSTTAPEKLDKEEIKQKTDEILEKIDELQIKMNAQKKYSLLIVLQGLDASGKDGVVRRIFSKTSPFGVSVAAFGKPTKKEYSYDFLWRIHQEVPAKGQVKIFNRSHYEDILVPSVEGYIAPEIIEKRYGMINSFEQLLESNDTKILKFFLNVSKERQKERLIERLELQRKHYKHNDSDWTTRSKFDQYIEVYERIFTKCNKVPWHIIPSDQNWSKTYYVAKEILKALKSMDLRWPNLDSELFEQGNIKVDSLE